MREPTWFLEGNIFMPEPTITTPQDDKKPAGVISFEEAAHNFTGEPFGNSKARIRLRNALPYVVQGIAQTDYGWIEAHTPQKILTPIPILWSGEQTEVIADSFSNITTANIFKEVIVSQPVTWTKYTYYREKERELRHLTKDFPARVGEDKPHIPVYYEKQIQWYRQQQDYYYDLLFESVSSTNKTGTVDYAGGEQ